MGCGSLFLEKEKAETALRRSSGRILSMIMDLAKGNMGVFDEESRLTRWIHQSPSSVVQWAVHKRSKVSRVVKIITRNEITEKKAMREIKILK